jgi:hypothetical protein
MQIDNCVTVKWLLDKERPFLHEGVLFVHFEFFTKSASLKLQGLYSQVQQKRVQAALKTRESLHTEVIRRNKSLVELPRVCTEQNWG